MQDKALMKSAEWNIWVWFDSSPSELRIMFSFFLGFFTAANKAREAYDEVDKRFRDIEREVK